MMSPAVYNRPTVIVHAPSSIARFVGLLRLALLTLVALRIAHDAIYAVHFGVGHAFTAAMGDTHAVYWPMFTAVGIAAAIVLSSAAAIRLRRLGRQAASRRGRITSVTVTPRPAYLPELARLWAALWLLVTLLYLGLENVEAVVASGHVLGFEPLAGADARMAIPILALVTFALAALGALVRWRIAVLQARIAGRVHAPRRRAAASAPAREWDGIGALVRARWFVARPDAGRAPPVALHS